MRTVKVAVDVDGVILARPDVFVPFITALMQGGAEVVILTSHMSRLEERLDVESVKEESLAKVRPAFGSRPLPWVQVCIGRSHADIAMLKGAYCKEHGIDFMIDNNELYCYAARRSAPQVVCFKVMT
jgi:hypothetical protein